MSKTVFILGAGFSAPAGLPTQNQLAKELFSQELFSKNVVNNYLEIQRKFIAMLEDDFGVKESNRYLPLLEDIYTPIDRSILENASFRSFHPEELLNLRHVLDTLLISVINSKSKHNKASDYIHKFAKYLIELSKDRTPSNYKVNNPVAVITTNWDTLLDFSIHNRIKEGENCTIDYMCYINSLNKDDTPSTIPAIEALKDGKFTIKLLKIHGSINWLQCPKCQRIFAHFFQRLHAFGIIEQKPCTYCVKNFDYSPENTPKLRTLMLMPTFEKDLSNFQTKLIWRNAGNEISSAEEIIFIGYSFPLADFEFRQLLFRNIRKNAKIKVVLYRKKEQDIVLNHLSDVDNVESPEFRYLSFFGGKKIEIFFKGVERFVNEDLIA